MSPRQAQTLAFIRDYIDEHGHSPTYEQIAAGIGRAHKGGAHGIVARLIKLGHLRSDGGGSRNLMIAVPQQGEAYGLRFVPTSMLKAEIERRDRAA